MARRYDHAISLDERTYTTAEVAFLSGVAEKNIRNWTAPARNVLQVGERHFTGRVVFSLLDAVRLAAMHDLTVRVPLKPSDAAGAAEVLVRYVAEHSPKDGAGHPVADPSAINRTLAFALAYVEGEPHVGLVDSDSDFRGQWGRAHVVLPIAAIVAGVLSRLLDLATRESVS
jgi:hypothetical protein